MISQPDVLQPDRGAAFADLRRGLTIADLKANVVNQTVDLPIRNGVAKVDGQTHREPDDVPELQTVLLLYQPKTRYALTPKHPVPELRHNDEVLIKIEYVGLNPIDWKAP